MRGFDHVETWVFDLDNTLYPHHLNLWQQVDDRIRSFIADYLKVPSEQAFRIQKDYYRRYGTTMRGLMTEHGLTPGGFLDFVHRIDHSPLQPDAALGAALERLPGRKLVLTNGTRAHADAVMRRLAVHQHFEDVFDIIAADLEPKPAANTYRRFLDRHGVDPADKILYTTGRLTSEMIIKTVRMGIPILVSRSGFTAWGVDLARQVGLTLVGRARGKRFIVLSGAERIIYDQNLAFVEDESARHKRKGGDRDE